MPNNWKTYKLGDLISYQKGFAFKSDWFKEKGDLIVRVSDTTSNSIDISSCHRVDKEKSITLQRYKLEKDDIVIATVGSWPPNYASVVGKVVKVPKEADGALLNQNAVRLKSIDDSLHSKKYIYYLMKSDSFLRYIVNTAQGSANQASIKLTDIFDFKFDIPSIQEQQSIASILSAIDDKIENNLAINKTLEEMAMALYKHWFVDFGPFQDGEFVQSELGMIPKGWEVKRLDDLIDVVSKGTTPRMKDVAGLEIKIPFLKVKDVNTDGEINTNNIDLIPEEIHLKDLKRSILYENDLLFSIAGTIGRVSIVTKHLDNSNCNQALAFIRLKDKEKFKSFIYYWLKSDEIQNRIQNSVVQGVQANISLTVLKDLKIPISSDFGIIEKYSEKVNPILELILQNQEENRLLRTQRDTLLPQLISGAVRLKEFRE
jgi:type I restriction enzyme S subunit